MSAEELPRFAEFLYREAMLLDDKNWDEWLKLYTEDCFYWVPSVPQQKDPIDTISIFAEDRMRIEMRIIRITHPRAYSQEFPTRQSRIVGNIMIDPEGGRASAGGLALPADIV
ncbi:MAG TPA: aromatic-ring-hydroxylating dioxygenase subunit beta, partial [Stellaceae bacterium]|nr:aromatic-ring-hydroxylating dioxygenase subunit beta [Stellaceae bacterium]